MCAKTDKQLKAISHEFIIIMITLLLNAAGTIWWAATITNRVAHLEYEANKGGRNTAADGAVRDEQIKVLTRVMLRHTAFYTNIENKIDKISEDMAEMRGELRHLDEKQ